MTGREPAAGRQAGGDALGPGAEFDLIRRFLAGSGGVRRSDVRVGPGDDCAVVAGEGIALSIDLSVEGIHFRRDWLAPPEIGYRAATAALSDLAAVAARPIGVLASLAVGAADAAMAEGVMQGIRAAAADVGAVVLGGDLTRSPGPVVIDVAVVGEATRPVLRTGARPGDEVWVTGRLGGAAVAVRLLLRNTPPPAGAMQRFAAPVARVREARWLAHRIEITAMLDLSDGLLGDAGHLAAASGVALVLEPASIPVHPDARTVSEGPEDAMALAVSGGEDYELCFCAPAGAVEPLAAEFHAEFGVPLTRVGDVEPGTGVHWRTPSGKRADATGGGFQHFGTGA